MRNILLIALMLVLSGCNSSNEEQKETKEAEAPKSAIKITQDAVDTNVKEKSEKKSDGGQFYYSLDKKKKSSNYDANDSKERTTIDAYLHIKSPYERVRITMMIKKLSKTYVVKCSPCHDDYANGIIGPSLLDKNATFIYDKIAAFKTGKKKNVLMKELVSQMDDDTLKSLAQEIAEFNKQIREMREGR